MAENVRVDYTKYNPREWFKRNELVRDHVAGLCGFRRPYTGKLFLPAIDSIRDGNSDVVILHEGHYATSSIPYWRREAPHLPVVLYVHTPLSRAYTRRELQRTLRGVSGVVCVSNFTAEQLEKRLGQSPCPIGVVHNGVDTELFTPNQDATDPEVFEVLFVGQVAPHKGPHLLLRAIARASTMTRRSIRVRIVGSSVHMPGRETSPYEEQLRTLSDELRVDAQFQPFLPRTQLVDVYRSSSVVCVPSLWTEPFGLVVLEAMACGKPVIASNRGGIPEGGGDVAVYVDPEDEIAFASVLVELAEDPGRLSSIGESARARAEGFSWSHVYGNLVEMLDSFGISPRG